MKTKKNIQVFMVGDQTCEIDGELVSITHTFDLLHIKTKNGNYGFWEYYLPIARVQLVRISDF